MKTLYHKQVYTLNCIQVIMLCTALLFSLISYGRQPEKHYFFTGSGNQVDIMKINYFNGDSLFFDGMDRMNTYILVDSIAEYHHFKPAKKGTGFLVGGLIGGFIGGMIATATHQQKPIDQSNALTTLTSANAIVADESLNFAAGFAIGIVAGGIAGIVIAANSKVDLHIDLRNYNRLEKKQLLSEIFSEKTPSK